MTATQQCGECRSPLRPCRCDRPKKQPRRITVRSFRDVHAGDPLVYGVIYDRLDRYAKSGVCMLKMLVDQEAGEHHRCRDWWRATAHHSPSVGSGGNDLSCGPVCGLADDMMHSRLWGWTEGRVFARFGVNVRDECKEWARQAVTDEFGSDLPDWLKEVHHDHVLSGLRDYWP